MKKLKTPLLGALVIGLFAASTSVACNGEDEPAGDGDGDGDGDMGGTAGDGDGDGSGGTGSGDGDGDGTGGTTPVDECPDHPAVTDIGGGACEIEEGEITEDLHLTLGKDYLLGGGVFIGDDNGGDAVLTIDPGVTIYGGDTTFLVIQRGSQIMAEGTADAPIVFTSAAESRAPSDWGGLVINGRAPTNNGEDVQGEAGSGLYGGTDEADNSGVLKYVRVEFAGNLVDAENELNGIAFQGVGSGTEVEYIQVHRASDDGIEFFGGTVNVKHVLITGADDDSVDWTGGWTGMGQFIAVQQWDGSGDKGIEADNNGDTLTATPMSQPILSNVTLWSNQAAEATGALFRAGTGGEFHNFVIGGFPTACISLDSAETVANAGSGDLVMAQARINCDTSFVDGATATAGDTEAFFDGGTDNMDAVDLGLTDAANEAAPDLTPESDSTLLTGGVVPSDAFFDDVDYIGAFDEGDDWATGWTAFPTE